MNFNKTKGFKLNKTEKTFNLGYELITHKS
jgi:hypothetical protein